MFTNQNPQLQDLINQKPTGRTTHNTVAHKRIYKTFATDGSTGKKLGRSGNAGVNCNGAAGSWAADPNRKSKG